MVDNDQNIEARKLVVDNIRLNIIACSYIREAARLLSYSIPDVSVSLYNIALCLLDKVDKEEIDRVEEIKNYLSNNDSELNFEFLINKNKIDSSCGV